MATAGGEGHTECVLDIIVTSVAAGGIEMNNFVDRSLKEPEAGLLWAFRFDGINPPTLLDGIPDNFSVKMTGEWYWFHFASAHEQARNLIRKLPNLSEDAKDRLIDQDGGLRLDIEGETIFGAILDFERDLTGRTKDTAKLSLALNPDIFVSIRRHALYSTDRVRRQFGRGEFPSSPLNLLELIFSHFALAAGRELAELSETLDDIEDRVLQPEVNDDRVRLAPIRRMSARFHRDMLAIRSSLGRFEKLQISLPNGFDDVSNRLARELEALDHDAVLVQDRARLLQDEMAAKTNAAINDNLRILSVLTALLLPPTLISGIFGMNVKDLPFLETDGGFWYVIGLGLLSSFLAYRLMKKLDIT